MEITQDLCKYVPVIELPSGKSKSKVVVRAEHMNTKQRSRPGCKTVRLEKRYFNEKGARRAARKHAATLGHPNPDTRVIKRTKKS